MNRNKYLAEVPTTGRTPDFLAKRYGFKSLDALIDSLPARATVLDIGAGMSLFGHVVARRRPDITWINIDPYYTNPHAQAAIADAPKNVRYMSDDLTVSITPLGDIRADQIFSYWVLPHMSLVNDRPAEKLAGAMWELLKPEGKMTFGPDHPYRVGSLFRHKRAVSLRKSTPKKQAVHLAVTITRLPWFMRMFQDFVNRRLRPAVRPVLRSLVASQMRRARNKHLDA